MSTQTTRILVFLALCYAFQMAGFVMISPLFRRKKRIQPFITNSQ